MANIKKIIITEPDSAKTIVGTAKASIKKVGNDSLAAATVAFKTKLREIADVGIEYIFSTEQEAGVGALDDTGDEGIDADIVSNDATISADSTGGFDGYFEVPAADDYLRLTTGVSPTPSKIMKDRDRTYIFVYDQTDDLPNSFLNLGGTGGSSSGASNNAWGWMIAGANGTNTASGVCSSRYLFLPHPQEGVHAAWAQQLIATQATHSAGATKTDFVSNIPAGQPNPYRTVFWISYDLSEETATIRWKQTGNGSGHTYIEGSAEPDTTIVSNYTYLWGYLNTGPVDSRIKYIGVVDELLSAANFDTLADIALGN